MPRNPEKRDQEAKLFLSIKLFLFCFFIRYVRTNFVLAPEFEEYEQFSNQI